MICPPVDGESIRLESSHHNISLVERYPTLDTGVIPIVLRTLGRFGTPKRSTKVLRLLTAESAQGALDPDTLHITQVLLE
jgi:hypothetical protein